MVDALGAWRERAATAGLGLTVGAVRVEDGAAWATTFDALCGVLRVALPDRAVVEHVGSTSVPGLVAKPIVDVAVGVIDDEAVLDAVAALDALGLLDRGWIGDLGDRMLAVEGEPGLRLAHVHVVVAGGAGWRSFVDVRDALRGSADARARYAALKRRLAVEHAGDRAAYRDGKATFLAELLR